MTLKKGTILNFINFTNSTQIYRCYACSENNVLSYSVMILQAAHMYLENFLCLKYPLLRNRIFSSRHCLYNRLQLQYILLSRQSSDIIFTQNAPRFALGKTEFLVTRNFHKTSKMLSSSFFITIGSCTYILIRLCKYIPCLSFYNLPVLFCIYSVYFYEISRLS